MTAGKSQKLINFKNIPGCSDVDIQGFEQYIRKEISIREGLWLSIMNFSLEQSIKMEYERNYPVIDFGFVISANIKRRLENDSSGSKEVHLKSGITGVQYARDQKGFFEINPKEKHQIVHIHASLPFLKGVLKDDYTSLPPFFKSLLKQNRQDNFCSIQSMSPDIQAVVYQILNPSSNALPWNLYLEGKILELLSLKFAALSIDHEQCNGILLNSIEKKQIPRAKELLIRDLHSPPTLQDLSSMIGLSINKLQRGFRQLYGKSVFDYFREHRMQTAKLLLETTETNVSETAWQVGYINVSHFSVAFKKRFGILPKHYLKESLKNQRSVSPTTDITK